MIIVKLIAKIRGRVPGLNESIKNEIAVTESGHTIIVLLREENFLEKKEKTWFYIPEPVMRRPHHLLIECEEMLETAGEIGCATIICGTSGKEVRPFMISRSTGKAIFSLLKTAAVVKANTEGMISITEYEIKIGLDSKQGYVWRKRLWSGTIEELPQLLLRYERAANNALKKALSSGNPRVFYADSHIAIPVN
ncbi:MAG: hypothetical protein PHG23_02135 [Candidatus Pacebacteria bacterium]|nr:hypothetical protein [Candidatus Paceibacterota bacterium]